MGRVQVAIEREVHPTPLGVWGQDGALGASPRGWGKLFGELSPRLQSDANCGPPERKYTKKFIFLHNSKPWGSKNCLSKHKHPKHLPRFDEGGGMHRKQRPFMPQG
jgi:hypothetical protein